MLLLFSNRVAERLPVWERVVHLVYWACLSIINFCVCPYFPFGFEGGMEDLILYKTRITAFLFTLSYIYI